MLVDGPRAAAEHMALDERLAREARLTVRLFSWHPAAMSLGWKQPWPAWLDDARWREAGIELIERPTGGGIAFHGSDVSLAVVVPRSLRLPLETLMRAACQSAALLCEASGVAATCVLDAKSEGPLTYCLTQPAPYAVYAGERKVAGFAIRRYPESWLVHGSLLVRPLPEALAKVVPTDVMEQLSARAVPLAEMAKMPVSIEKSISWWGECWSSWWEELRVEGLVLAS